MSEPSKKIVLPAYLIRRLEAYRIAKGSEYSYVLRDKLYGKTYDFDPWQFFVLEVLPGCESLDKLQTVFRDRFDRDITQQELETLFSAIADQKLFEESALQHPLLEQYAKRSFEVIDGKAVHKSFSTVGQAAPAAAAATTGAPATPTDAKAASAALEDSDRGPLLATRLLDLGYARCPRCGAFVSPRSQTCTNCSPRSARIANPLAAVSVTLSSGSTSEGTTVS